MYDRRKRTRLMNQINVVPYIDVMLVLLVIFMVTAPLITTTVIELRYDTFVEELSTILQRHATTPRGQAAAEAHA